MAGHLVASAIRPGVVWCSSACRARETLDLLRPAIGADAEVHVTERVYDADADELLELLQAVEATVASVMIVGHNPALQDLAIRLCGDGDDAALAQLHARFPAGALATLDLGDVCWPELGPGRAFLVSLIVPRRAT